MLVYDQPINQAKPDARAETRAASGFDLFALFELLWRRKLMIIASALITACAAVVVGKSLTPRFTATAELYIDPRELQLVDRELIPRAQDVSGLSMVVESQARLITSNSVLRRVIQDTKIDKDPEFGGATKGPLASLLGLLGLELRSTAETKEDDTATLDALTKHINVRKTERSFVVDIDVWSHDPAKAAMLANALAEAYLADSKSTQAAAARRATSELSGRLKELQQRLRNAEDALAVYKAQNNFIGTQDSLLSDQQLSSSNQRLAAAHAATLDAQARFDQIEKSRNAATDAGATPEALQSPTIANLRAQYAEARKKYAELSAELGPLHPSLKQMEKQVDDLRRTINEEVDRFEQSAKNDLIRAREYEASMTKALDKQKRQSVELSQASVRLRELERDVAANRDVYQAFLKRSRETEEQESLNTSASRVIGEATVPLHRSFPPAMSLIAMLGLMLGGLGAVGWVVAADRLPLFETDKPQPADPQERSSSPVPDASRRGAPAPTVVDKPVIARLQDSDVIRTLGGILGAGPVSADVTRFGWPTLRPGFPLTTFLNALRDMRAAVERRSSTDTAPVIAVVSDDECIDRCVAALNFALAAARDGANVLMIDADRERHKLSSKVARLGQSEPSHLGWLSIGTKASRAVKTANGISILPGIRGSSDAKAVEVTRKSVTQARAAGGYDLVVLDGPALPRDAADRKLFEIADGIVAVLPVSLDINDAMEDIIASLGPAQRKLAGVILNELTPSVPNRQRDRQYA
ncbi:MAG TPA: exopolysaccharide transport family protein [Bradyrhizobium sp.]|uniref:exopolysaccharide transport family protein n=1 Tax=Bradyrhizobium sp. TaxID=376 RepID=UPI002C256CA4|nr:exopolysaccharide transport family protein [Bradyrhizobium sp.]HLZ02378.1 exopolysaccharide transport family protein [Bradyrhizobium sp.]